MFYSNHEITNLNSSNNKYKNDWKHTDFLSKSVDGRHPVQQHNKQKVQVGKSEHKESLIVGDNTDKSRYFVLIPMSCSKGI